MQLSQRQIIDQVLSPSRIHKEWQSILEGALEHVDSEYLLNLLEDKQWLPGIPRLFAAFQRDLKHCRYILFGESPYPRKESANGIAFYDAAVKTIWSENGLSKPVNRATSLRNIVKTALVSQQLVTPDEEGKITQSMIANIDKQNLITSLEQLFTNLQQKGFLLFNATPVLHPDNKPAKEARNWLEFLNQLLVGIASKKSELPTLVLWGKIARQMESLPAAANYPRLTSEHPYNISFINNASMQQLFADLELLDK